MKIGCKGSENYNTNQINLLKVMKRFQIYKNGKVVKDADRAITAERMFENVCKGSDEMIDSVELYDSVRGFVIRSL